jgi:CoA:oxalate CoA-transferase
VEARPLSGIRVLDLGRVVAAPLCGRLLADQGAEVIKVEPPRRDMTRTAPPIAADFSSYFAHLNAGKLGLCANLEDPEMAALLAELAVQADVVLENFRPGVLERYGLDAATLRERNPRLVYCSISGYGQTGPWRERRAYAPVVHGEVGVIATNARLHDVPARPEALSHADVQSALMAMGAISSALLARERTGEGAWLDVSLADVAIYINEFSGPELCGQTGPASYGGAASLVLTLADGTRVVTQGNPTDNFRQWAKAMGRPELREDPRFATHEARVRHHLEIERLILEFARGIGSFEALHACVDPHRIAVGVVRSLPEVADTEWAKERGLVAEPLPGLRFPRVPYRSSAGEIGATGPPPRRGEHNREALGRLAGLDEEAVAALEARGALHAAEDGRS